MRLIDADALKEYSYGREDTYGDIKQVVDVEDIDNAPTIDDLSSYSDKLWQTAYERGKTEARLTGHWIKIGELGLGYKCNKCEEVDVIPRNFCGYCGADMRGDKDHA